MKNRNSIEITASRNNFDRVFIWQFFKRSSYHRILQIVFRLSEVKVLVLRVLHQQTVADFSIVFNSGYFLFWYAQQRGFSAEWCFHIFEFYKNSYILASGLSHILIVRSWGHRSHFRHFRLICGLSFTLNTQQVIVRYTSHHSINSTTIFYLHYLFSNNYLCWYLFNH